LGTGFCCLVCVPVGVAGAVGLSERFLSPPHAVKAIAAIAKAGTSKRMAVGDRFTSV